MKYSIFIILGILIFQPVFATTVDFYSGSNVDEGDWNTVGDNAICAESFTGNGDNIIRYDSWFKNNGSSVTGTMKAVLYAHTGVFGTSSVGTGSQLAESSTEDLSTLTGTYASYSFEFTGGNQYTLINGTKYVIGILIDQTGGAGSTRCTADYTSPTHDGNLSIYSGTWTAYADGDRPFYVFGEAAATPTPSPGSSISYASSSFDDIDIADKIVKGSLQFFLAGLIFAIWYFSRRNKKI